MSKSSVGALTLAHAFLRKHVVPGSFCIDATAGRGGDTALLCELAGNTGRVLAFDIQQEAVESTRARLAENGLDQIGRVVLDSHANMAQYAQAASVDCIVFNFGWLPGGDHGIFTRPESSIAAIEQGLELLKPGGVMCLCIYYGRDCGFAERDALLKFVSDIDFRRFTVITAEFCNRPNNPPIPVFITRDE